MPKETIPFSAFVEAAGPQHGEFINWLHAYAMENNFTVDIKDSKNGYVVSYIHAPTKRTVANYVFRKKGPMLRIYADNVATRMDILETLPDSMKKTIAKSAACRRMLNPEACNPRCLMGYDFLLEGKREQKCRYGGFMFFLDDETKPYLKEMMEQEISARIA